MKPFFYTLLALIPFALGACGGGTGTKNAEADIKPLPSGNPTDGETVFMGTCIKCHGKDATGIEGSGTNLTISEFVRDHTDTELVEYIKLGRPMNDPLNTTGIAMPPYGANPMLTDQDLADVVSYLRTVLQILTPDKHVNNDN